MTAFSTRTWVTAELVTASLMNTYIRDSLLHLKELDTTGKGCRVFHSIDQSIATATVTALAFDSERYDTDTMHDLVTNNGRITFTTAGKYLVGAAIVWGANATGYRYVEIRAGGSVVLAKSHAQALADAVEMAMTICGTYDFAAADYVELRVEQNSGISLAVARDSAWSPEFWAQRIG